MEESILNATEIKSKDEMYTYSYSDLKWYWKGEDQFAQIAKEFSLLYDLKVCFYF